MQVRLHLPSGLIDSSCWGGYKRPEASLCEGKRTILGSALHTSILSSQRALPNPQICSVSAPQMHLERATGLAFSGAGKHEVSQRILGGD